MFVTAAAGAEADTILQYQLGTNWDVSTAVFDLSVDVSTEDTAPNNLVFRPDGLSFFILGLNNDIVYKYNNITAWDITGATYSTVSFDPAEFTSMGGFTIRNDGYYLYLIDDDNVLLREYRLTTPWDITTTELVASIPVESTSINAPIISPYLDKMLLLNQTGDIVEEFTLGLLTGKVISDGFEVSRLGIQTFEIFSAAELDVFAVGGIITVTTPTEFVMKTPIVTATKFVNDDGVLALKEDIDGSITWIGTGTFLSGKGDFVVEVSVTNANAGTTFIDVPNQSGFDTVRMTRIIATNFENLGEIGGILLADEALFLQWTNGFRLKDNIVVDADKG
jgi:hypothetical protein